MLGKGCQAPNPLDCSDCKGKRDAAATNQSQHGSEKVTKRNHYPPWQGELSHERPEAPPCAHTRRRWGRELIRGRAGGERPALSTKSIPTSRCPRGRISVK